MLSFLRFVCLFVFGVAFLQCGTVKKRADDADDKGKNEPTKIDIEVLARYEHNTANFTQGLIYDDSKKTFWESTGQHNTSRILSYPLQGQSLGKATQWVNLSGEYFGEGITMLADKMYQLTWKEHALFVYQMPSMKLLKRVTIPYEGWGITTDGTSLIISDGTSKVRWIDPNSFNEIKHILVSDPFGSLDYINELELVKGKLYANRWQTDKIIRIDTATGEVNGEIDLSYLSLEARDKYPQSDVANGIAYDASRDLFFLTGKYWPYIYEVRLK